ncbi:phosphoribosylamine--glycine ligase [Candidatus Dependentiae bacterium]|nr:phosphoribosylamine--glycine ligase [Candidatus Dependentiae bacterium]
MFNLIFALIFLSFINFSGAANLNILIVGGGGREHAITWKVAQSPLVNKIYVAPGNPGTAQEPRTDNISITEISDLIKFAKENQIDLTIVGPENYLANGIVDEFHSAGLRCFGPTKKAAQIESSKVFSKEFMKRNNIPTAKFEIFTCSDQAKNYIEFSNFPIVIKADGLCSGKGVFIAHSKDEAFSAIEDMLDNKIFGDSGTKIIIEEFIEGKELSFFVLTDGENILQFSTAQDHKRLLDGNNGSNTGGMGAYSPVDWMAPKLRDQIITEIAKPTITCLQKEGCSFTGILYIGLMITPQGAQVLEYNARLGDPEAQVILSRLKTDFVELCLATEDKKLKEKNIEWDERCAVGVVLASKGYPIISHVGDKIEGLTNLVENTKIFHAATKIKKDNCVTNGGRVLCCTALGDTLIAARQSAYELVSKLYWPGMLYRTDIGMCGN